MPHVNHREVAMYASGILPYLLSALSGAIVGAAVVFCVMW